MAQNEDRHYDGEAVMGELAELLEAMQECRHRWHTVRAEVHQRLDCDADWRATQQHPTLPPREPGTTLTAHGHVEATSAGHLRLTLEESTGRRIEARIRADHHRVVRVRHESEASEAARWPTRYFDHDTPVPAMLDPARLLGDFRAQDVTASTRFGRATWRAMLRAHAEGPIHPRTSLPEARRRQDVAIEVDAATGIVVVLDGRHDGAVVSRTELTLLAVDADVGPEQFSMERGDPPQRR